MIWILNITTLVILANFHLISGTLKPTLYWKFDSMTSDGFVNEANSPTNNRGFLLQGTDIVHDSYWNGVKFKGNLSGIIIDNVTDTCFLVPQNCTTGLSISFHVKWPRNSTAQNNGSLISSGNFSIVYLSHRNLVVSLWNGTSEWQLTHARNISVYGWVCYTVTWDHSSLRFYVNGSLNNEVTTNDTQMVTRNGIYMKRSIYSLGDRALPRRIAIGNVAQIGVKEYGVKMLFDDLKVWDFALMPNVTKRVCRRGYGHGKKLQQNPYKFVDQAYTSIQFAHKALYGFTFNSITVTNLNHCIDKCKKKKCMSFNIGKGNSTNEYVCQLNLESRMHYPQNIIEKQNYYYYDVYWQP